MWDVVGWGIIWSDQDLGCASSFGETQEAVSVRNAWNVSFCWSWKWRFTDVVEILGVIRMGNFLFLPQAWLVCKSKRSSTTDRDRKGCLWNRWRLILLCPFCVLAYWVLWHARYWGVLFSSKILLIGSCSYGFVVKWLHYKSYVFVAEGVTWCDYLQSLHQALPHGHELGRRCALSFSNGDWSLMLVFQPSHTNDIPL